MAKRKLKKEKEEIVEKENLNLIKDSENEESIPEDSQENVLEPSIVTVPGQNDSEQKLPVMPRINIRISR